MYTILIRKEQHKHTLFRQMGMKMKYYDCISKVSIATMKVMKTQASKNITTLKICLDPRSVIEFGACHLLSNKEPL